VNARAAVLDFVLRSSRVMPRRVRTSPRRSPRQKRAEDTVAVLLDATEIVLARRGFLATTTNKVAQAAGVSIGTLYHYFPSKEALIEAVVHRMWQREALALYERRALLERGPLKDAIGAMVSALVRVMAERKALYARWYAEASHLGQLGFGLDLADGAVSVVREALTRRREEVRPENIAFAADLAVKTVLAVVRTAARDYDVEVESGVLAEELTEMLARYLLK
jgi:AcrR family transcriptional regulator